MNNVVELMKHRFACKHYKDIELPEDVLNNILEAGRLSPSTFDLEPWTFHVCRSKDILKECFYQESMQTAPTTIVIVSNRGKALDPDSAFIKERSARFPGGYEAFIEDYKSYYGFMKDLGVLETWARSQSYIVAADMILAAKADGVDSCVIEGFDNDSLLSALGLAKEEAQIGLVIAFGYANETEAPKIREDLKSIVVTH